MRINNNLMAMNTHRQLGLSNTSGAKSMEKLSSGYRINRAGDDAAGLAISEKMRAQIRGLSQASRNSQDGISLIQTAEGALNETQSILQRMRELAVQSANDTNVGADRGEIQQEMNQLTSEINRIGNTTEFNTQKLLNGGTSSGAVSVSSTTAYDAGGAGAIASSLTIGGVNGLTITASSTGTAGDAYSVTVVQGAAATGVGAETASSIVVDASGAVTITLGTTWDGSASVNTALDANAIAALTPSGDGAGLVSFSVEGDGSGNIAVAGSANLTGGDNGSAATPASTTFELTGALAEGETLTVGGLTFEAVAAGGTASGSNVAIDLGTAATAADQAGVVANAVNTEAAFTASATGAEITISQTAAGTGDIGTPTLSGQGFSANLQIGANYNQSFNISIGDMRSLALKVSGDTGSGTVAASDGATATYSATATDGEYALDISDHANASAAISVINDAIESVSSERAKLGSYQNRLEHSIKNLDTSSENLQAAESRIRDVDMAQEMMEFTKNNILQQAAQAMLAQANQAPQGVLQLLR